MRSWIRNLRYTKAYWSMKDYRETVISVDQERMLLDRLLQEEEDQKDVSSHMTRPGNFGSKK